MRISEQMIILNKNPTNIKVANCETYYQNFKVSLILHTVRKMREIRELRYTNHDI